jgi:hypothetical protein
VRRFLRNRGLVTVALTAVAAALLVLAGWVILDRTTTDDHGPATGVIPAEMPDGFPIPAGADIGESTVDPARNQTTLILTTYGSLIDAVSGYSIGLVSSGYVVDESVAEDGGWVIRFSRLDLRGTIVLTTGPAGVASTITIVDP